MAAGGTPTGGSAGSPGHRGVLLPPSSEFFCKGEWYGFGRPLEHAYAWMKQTAHLWMIGLRASVFPRLAGPGIEVHHASLDSGACWEYGEFSIDSDS